ncbi:MAG: hypothetical protein JXA54_11025 [Candidatus Heimdallarchaeota archaeon]|nr:hypothetical protein [Candidatus Heimdallarchaeota archaeon]
MKKGLKISFIVIPIVLLLGAGTFIGTLLYTKNNVIQEIGETKVTSYILPDFGSFLGYIRVEIPINITNNGLYDILDLTISLKVYGQNFSITSLNGLLLGEGVNEIGRIKASEEYKGGLTIDMNQNISVLAIQDGDLEIVIDISLKLNVYLFKINSNSQEIQSQLWDSPFGI